MQNNYINEEIGRLDSGIERKRTFIETLQREIDLLLIQRKALEAALKESA